MSISFLHPAFDALSELGVTKAIMASRLSVPEETLSDPSMIVTANSVYAFLNWCTKIADNPMFCARVGQGMASGASGPLGLWINSAQTVGDFFQKFSHFVSKQSPAARYKLEAEGSVAIWRLTRPTTASADACYADAVAVGFFVQILRDSAQSAWDVSQIVAVVPDISLVPVDLLTPTSVMSGHLGLNLRFPSDYLALSTPHLTIQEGSSEIPNSAPKILTFEGRVRQVVQHRISEPGLGAVEVAKAMGLTKWKLQSLLLSQGVSFTEVKESIRRVEATRRVQETTDTVVVIAEDLGYNNSANLTRAFRRWTGKTPREMRRAQA